MSRLPCFLRVRRECAICNDLASEKVANPYCSLILQFVISHLLHVENGLVEIMKDMDDLLPQVILHKITINIPIISSKNIIYTNIGLYCIIIT